jgi:thiol-disulfide isomerase/thioredoxin
MKKGVLIAGGVLALLAVMYWADKKFPPPRGPAAGTAGTPNTPTDAPDVSLKDINDKDVTMAQYKGKIVLVNFWATWCEPCKVEIPWMIEFQQKYAARGFTILGISMDEEGKKVVRPFLDKERFDVNGQKEAMNYPILLGSGPIGEKFGGILGLPTSMLFTRDGKKVRTIVGLVNHDDISKVIEGML